MNYHFLIAVICFLVSAIPGSYGSPFEPDVKASEPSFTGLGTNCLITEECTKSSTNWSTVHLNSERDSTHQGEKTFRGFNVGAHYGMYGVIQVNSESEVGDGGGFAKGYFASYLHGKWITTIQYDYFDEFNFFGPAPSHFFHVFGVMHGFNHDLDRIIRVSVQTGLAYGVGRMRTEDTIRTGFFYSTYHSERYNTVGLVIKGRFQVAIFRYASIGISPMAYLNPRSPVFTFNINLTAGILKNRLTPVDE